MSKIINAAFGTIEIVGYEGPWRREIYRPHHVPANEPWNREVHERSMCVNDEDDTPRHVTYPSGYDSRCSCCYLNITHTEAVHAFKASFKRERAS